MAPKQRDLKQLDDDELAALEADLSEQRHDLMEQQRAVEVEKQIRTATANMSPDAKAALGIEVGGEMGTAGSAGAAKA